MRKLIVHMQMTLNGRIASGHGEFWEPFAWGEAETAYVNRFFAEADTWAMSRMMYDIIVPYWESVHRGEIPAAHDADAELAAIIAKLTKVVFSRTMAAQGDCVVISGDLAAQLAELKTQPGNNIVLSCGPATLSPLAATPGLIDEYLLAMHPAVIASGPPLLEDNTLALRLIDVEVFDGGAIVLRYAPAN